MENRRPYIVLIIIQAVYAGMFLISKAAFNGGMNSFVFVFYRQAFATVFLVPFAFILERKRAPPLSVLTFCKIFMLSLFGITISLNVYGVALVYTSATLAAAASNTLPVITFFLAVLLRTETMKLRTLAGATKILGVIICLAGAATLAFYKGPHLKPYWIHNQASNEQDHHVGVHSSKTWIKGVFLMLTSNTLWGLWIALQGKVLECYPSKLLITTLQCFLTTIQSFVIAIAVERNTQKWKLHLDAGLIGVIYCGVVVTGVTFYLQTWCIEKKGPVFVAMSTPLSLILTILCSVLLLGEVLNLGSVLGAILLVGGLYCVLWGKRMERKGNNNLTVEEGKDPDDKIPPDDKNGQQRSHHSSPGGV